MQTDLHRDNRGRGRRLRSRGLGFLVRVRYQFAGVHVGLSFLGDSGDGLGGEPIGDSFHDSIHEGLVVLDAC